MILGYSTTSWPDVVMSIAILAANVLILYLLFKHMEK